MALKILDLSDKITRWENSETICDGCFAETKYRVHNIIYQIRDDNGKSMWLCQKHYDIKIPIKKTDEKMGDFLRLFLTILHKED